MLNGVGNEYSKSTVKISQKWVTLVHQTEIKDEMENIGENDSQFSTKSFS